jgi:hypothetical protein
LIDYRPGLLSHVVDLSSVATWILNGRVNLKWQLFFFII